MLKHWTSHAEYQQSISQAVTDLSPSQLKKLSFYNDSLDKLTSLNLDPIGELLAPYYSYTGRPALHQPEILRSFILMMDQEVLSITNWVKLLHSDDLLSMIIGLTTEQLPPLGSYYDFIDRLWLRNSSLDRADSKRLFHFPKNSRPSKKPGKGKKLPNKHPQIVSKCVDFACSGNDFPFHYERLLQELFSLAAIVPSLQLGLIPDVPITIAGDGTCVHSHSDSLGRKVCDCRKQGIWGCKCDRRFPAFDASIGWDSDLNTWFYGYTLYALSTYNKELHVDLPLHLRFLDARRHDSIGGIIALHEFRLLNPDIPIRNLCLDSANDNYPTYQLCKDWDIFPFIDLNSNRGRPASIPGEILIDTDGTPLCQAGNRMVNWGISSVRKGRKWRCPLKCGKVQTCSCQGSCSTSDYGRVIYTKPDWDIRLYPPVPRGTKEYKETYKTRTCSERINNRILNDYHLHEMKIRGKKRYSFFAMIIGINIHLDARIKKTKLEVS
ncbi:MAG: hypothetical protein ACRDCA_24560 [Serratia sp. (in: enterobacteria)]|uniref:hypothetical protein n=1 Tax=Serratia sp. (in: enterobacteria) TaxID=616 RepID=UPI003F3C6E71